MIAIVDVHYGERSARAGCAVIAAWEDAAAAMERTAEIEGVEPYESGELYRRELPALLRVLEGVEAEVVVVDGYVWTAPERPGLGAHLHAARGGIVVGIAKSELPAAPAIEVHRGAGARPLWVSAVGMAPEEAARCVAAMHGEHRLPSMVVLADHLARGLTP